MGELNLQSNSSGRGTTVKSLLSAVNASKFQEYSGSYTRDLSVRAWLMLLSVMVFGRRSSDLDLVAALSGVVSLDCGIGGSANPKLGCVEWSKMGSLAFENCVAGTGSRGLSSEIAN